MVQGSRFLALFVTTLAPLALAGAGCLQNLGTDLASTDTSSTTGDDASAAASATGVNCGEDPTTGITLCSGISECPSIAVDPSALAGCGFRVHANSAILDLECVCSTYLCPIGVPDTCAQATTLLGTATSLVVCEQVNTGTCVQEEAAEAGTSPTGTTGTTSTCNNQCLVSCGAEPDCQVLCGC
jgi:hypothetical protein